MKSIRWMILAAVVAMMNVTAEEYEFLGTHYFASFYECDPVALNKMPALREALERASEEAGAHVLSTNEYVFPEGGVTIVSLLSESHASIHTYPEHQACFIDYFTCGTKTDFMVFEQVMKDHLQPKKVQSEWKKRD